MKDSQTTLPFREFYKSKHGVWPGSYGEEIYKVMERIAEAMADYADYLRKHKYDKIETTRENLLQLLCDPENQPHQFVGDEGSLRILLTEAFLKQAHAIEKIGANIGGKLTAEDMQKIALEAL